MLRVGEARNFAAVLIMMNSAALLSQSRLPNAKPRVLYVASHWPGAPSYGAQMRVLEIGRLLKQCAAVDLAIVSGERDSETEQRSREEFEIPYVAQPEEVPSGGWMRRLRHEFDPSFLQTDPWAVGEKQRQEFGRLLRAYDAVWIHTIRTANLLRIKRWPNSVLDVDDLPSRCYLAESKQAPSLRRRLLDRRMYSIWRRRERTLLQRFDVLTVCSRDDRRYLGGGDRVQVIPNGFQPPARSPRRSLARPHRLGFIGTFGWEPNVMGVEWFLGQVWPLVKREMPDVRLRLVGRKSREFAAGPDVDGLGWLDDPEKEIASWSAMVVPLLTGGGTRIKIAEGFARQCPVVSTSVGAFGYEVRSGVELLLAEDAKDFAQACLEMMRRPEEAEAMAQRAYQRFLERWTWPSYQGLVERALDNCLARRPS